MHDKLTSEINIIVLEMTPAKGSVGMMSSEDAERLIRQAATRGAMSGWVAGERTARSYWGKEMDKLRARIRELEK